MPEHLPANTSPPNHHPHPKGTHHEHDTPRYIAETDYEDGYVLGYLVWDAVEQRAVKRDWRGRGWQYADAVALAHALNTPPTCATCGQPSAELIDGVWLAHGPDADDVWSVYSGPILPGWEERS